MSKPFSGKLIITVALLFACSAIPAFANRGGGGGGGFHGGGGGGFHGGGSFRGGGGFSGGSAARGGGGFRSGRSFSAPPAGYGASRSYAPSARSGGGFASRPGSSSSRPNGNFAGGNQRFGNSPSARPGVADGQWHSFGGSTETHGAVGAPSQGGASNGGGLHVLNGNRGASTGAVRSFSGQRGEIFENAPAARNVVPRGQSLSTMHNSFGASLAGNSGFRSSGAFLGSSRFGNGSSFLGNRGFAGGVNTIPLRGGFNRFGFNNGFGFNRFGCWNCGFGFGGLGLGFGWGGWGLGWPGWGFGWWNPFWVDPWWGWSAPAYYGYPPYGYVYPDSENNPPPDYNSNPPAQDSGEGEYDQDNQGSLNSGSTNGNWGTPNGPSPALAPGNGALAVPVLIYLRNGSVLTVRDYWMIDGQLHYILMSGAQRAVNLEGVDLPRTNTENAKSGVKFIFKSEPSVTSPEPNGNGAPVQPNAQPGGPNTAAPTQQINAVPQPEART